MKAKRVFEFQRDKDITKSLSIGEYAPLKVGDTVYIINKDGLVIDNYNRYQSAHGFKALKLNHIPDNQPFTLCGSWTNPKSQGAIRVANLEWGDEVVENSNPSENQIIFVPFDMLSRVPQVNENQGFQRTNNLHDSLGIGMNIPITKENALVMYNAFFEAAKKSDNFVNVTEPVEPEWPNNTGDNYLVFNIESKLKSEADRHLNDIESWSIFYEDGEIILLYDLTGGDLYLGQDFNTLGDIIKITRA